MPCGVIFYSISELRKKHRFVVIATGAWKEGASPVRQGARNVIDALSFLEDSKKSACSLELGKRVAVIGAVGARVDTELFTANGIALNGRGEKIFRKNRPR